MPGYSVDVIDRLDLEEALEMGLQKEEFTRKKKLPESLLPHLLISAQESKPRNPAA
jgi:hypothetical protein